MSYISGTPKEKTPQQTPPNQDSSPNPKSERHPAYFRLPEQSPTQPKKLPQLNVNSRTRNKSARLWTKCVSTAMSFFKLNKRHASTIP
jgi:hypothetical protein